MWFFIVTIFIWFCLYLYTIKQQNVIKIKKKFLYYKKIFADNGYLLNGNNLLTHFSSTFPYSGVTFDYMGVNSSLERVNFTYARPLKRDLYIEVIVWHFILYICKLFYSYCHRGQVDKSLCPSESEPPHIEMCCRIRWRNICKPVSFNYLYFRIFKKYLICSVQWPGIGDKIGERVWMRLDRKTK